MQSLPSAAVESCVMPGPRREWSAPLGLPGLVRTSALRTPDAVALTDVEGTLTYAQLEVESDAVAERLRAAGGRPGNIVAVCMRRSRGMVVALLGALKAHMPYLPLSTDDPQQRRELLVELSGARFTLVDAGTEELLPAHAEVETISVELGFAGADRWSDLVPYEGDEPVYVLFTSGTTGTPKGVVLPSDALINRLLWMHEEFGFTAADRFLQKTPYTFDVSGWELWSPLIAGSTMVLLAPGCHVEPGEVAKCIVDNDVTLCHFVPSMLNEFLRWPTARRCTSLRAVFCSGEELTPVHLARFHYTLDAQVHNLYGPTEAAIDVTHWPCPDGDIDRTLIGSPISNCTLVVLDEDHSPTEVGAVGQLAIGGVPLAIGYLGRPDLTESAFIDAPAWAPVSRLYLTGDLVRQLPEGIQYLGRKDAQVKIRGNRVELSAVEDALREVGVVGDAAATTVDRGSGHELCALVVPVAGSTVDPRDVRTELRQALSDSHVPTLIFGVESLSLSSSGKLDRRSVQKRTADLVEALRCGDDVSEDDQLSKLWSEVTGTYPANAETGFLDAGGHSLTAASFVGLILTYYGVRLSLRELLLANMSLADVRSRLETATPIETLEWTVGDNRALSPQQHGLWVWSRLFPECPAYNVTAVLELDRCVDVARLERAVAALVRRHAALRTTFHDDGEHVQRVLHSADEVVVEVRAEQSESIRTQVLDHLFVPDRPTRVAVGVKRDASGSSDTLLIALDHLVADQRSLDLVLADLAELYKTDAPLPAEADDVGFAPATAERRKADLAFWRERLMDAPRTLNLPWQRQRPETSNFRGVSVDLELGEEGSGCVEASCARNRATPFALVLSVFARRLGLWAGVDDLVVGVPMTGRETPAEQDAVGFYVRTLPIRLQAVTQQPEAAVTAAAEALFEAAEHATVSFEEIVEQTGAFRDLTQNPIFRAWCNDVSHEESLTEFGEAAVQLVHPPARWSLFDLGLYLHRTATGALSLRLVYSTDLWHEETATEFLRQCGDDLLHTVGSVPAVDAVSVQQVARQEITTRTYADLVERVLSKTESDPDRIALTGLGQQLTYGELRKRILQVSHAIRAQGEGRAAAGVLARRHYDLAPAVLGCWHAGTAPMLIDADAPEAWRRDALSAADAEVLVEVAPGGTDQASRDVLRLTDRWWQDAPAPETLEHRPANDDIGHILLTSGTTGKPSVVALPADALPDILDGYAEALGLSAVDVFAFTAPPDHDPVFRDLVLPLALGATVHAGFPEELGHPGMANWLQRVNATVWHTTPAQAQLMAGAHPNAALPSLRRVVFHGDLLRYGTVAMARRLAPAAEVYNLYGTTETPQAGGLRRIDPSEQGTPETPVPVGARAPYRKLTVVGSLAAEQIGVLGELTVTGAGLALGVLTQSGTGTGRYERYRTGDLGRLRLDGLVDVVGRADHQVSIGGHRVELDAVTAVVRGIRGVEDCHVAAEAGTSRLIAWVSASADLRGADIIAMLRRRIPQEAVPAQVRLVEAIPLTARGKVDTDALWRSAVDQDDPPSERDHREASGVLEIVLGAVREQQPGLDLGPDDNFFDAGLTSLDLLRLHDAIQTELGTGVVIADFFRFPTARCLSQQATETQEATDSSTATRVRRNTRGDPADELKRRRTARRIASSESQKGF